jgi:microcystin-dependent protein
MNGQLLSISQNTALFSLLGTTYGGDGKSNFALPDLEGRAPIGADQGPGLELYDLGQQGGVANVDLLLSELPAHTHAPAVSTAAGNQRDPFVINPPAGRRWAGSSHVQYSTLLADANMAGQVVGFAGGGGPHSNESPYLAVTFCIALEGIFPARN